MGADIFFFTDVDLLNDQTAEQAFGPVSGCEDTQYRVTSMHTATSDPNAYAVCEGLVFAQFSDDEHINILLRPSQANHQFGTKIKYFIYKNIKKSSLIDDDSKEPILKTSNSIQNSLLHIVEKSKEKYDTAQSLRHDAVSTRVEATPKILGLYYENTDLLNEKAIDFIFQANLLNTFLTVPVGTILGTFDKESFGFEVVTNDVHNGVSIGSLKSFPEIITCEGTGTNAKEKFLLATERERILNYIDPCCFFASFYEVKDKWANYNTSKKTNLRLGNGSFVTNSYLYENILSKFLNKNIVYLDIRNQVDNSLNYLHNYSDSTSEYATIRIGYDGGEKTELLYKDNYGWPLLRIPTLQFTRVHQQRPSSITVQLPIGDNQRPKIYTEQGCYYKDFPHSEKVLRDLYRDADYPTYTIVFALGVPKHNPTTTLPCYIKLRYFRGIQEDNNVNLNDEHFLDNLFSVNKLMSMEGDSPRLPFRSMDGSQWFSEVEDVFLDKTSGYGKDVTLTSGVIQEENIITFYALKDTKLLQGNGQQQSNLQNVPYLQNSEMSKLVISGNHPLIKTNVFPDSMFSEEVENLLNDDGRDIVLLQIANYEWLIIRDAVLQLDERFDAHISLRHKGTNNNIAQYEIVVRGFVEGDTDFEKETISTGIYIFKQVDDNGKRLFYTVGASSLFQDADVIERNRRNFQGSFIAKEKINVRTSPEKSDNVLIQIKSKSTLTVLGRFIDTEKKLWYYVESAEPNGFSGLDPSNGIKEKKVNERKGWIRANLDGAEDEYDKTVYITASINQFIADLSRLNAKLDNKQFYDTQEQRISRLRKMTHKNDLIGKMFNIVIGDHSAVSPPEYWEEIENEPCEEINIDDKYVIDGKLQLFRDYMGVKITDNIIIDLHHLFVGLDVLNSYPKRINIKDILLNVIFDLSSFSWDPIIELFCSTVDFATWAGDIGSVAVDYLLDQKKEKRDLEYFYNNQASEIDLISDIIVHKIHDKSRKNTFNSMESMFYYLFIEMKNDGLKSYLQSYFQYMGINCLKCILDNEQSYVYKKMLNEINKFSYLWDLYRFACNLSSIELKPLVSDIQNIIIRIDMSITNIDDFLFFSMKMYNDLKNVCNEFHNSLADPSEIEIENKKIIRLYVMSLNKLNNL